MKLMMSGKYEVNLMNEDSTQEFEVLFSGPKDSPYEEVSCLLIKNLIHQETRIRSHSHFIGVLESLSSFTRHVSI
jgi:hypothetical protein